MAELTVHPTASAAAELAWRRCAPRPPYHGAWVASASDLLAVLDRIPAELQAQVRLLEVDGAWAVVLLGGQTPEALTPWPLARAATGPFLFHPADAAPNPPLTPELLRRAGGGAHLLGRVEGGGVAWRRWEDADALTPGGLLRLDVPRRRFEARPPVEGPEPLGAFPAFASEALPTAGALDAEEKRRLAGVEDPAPSFWSKLFGGGRTPDWRGLLDSPGSAIRRGIRGFWSWVDAKVGPGQETGWLRRMFDPDQWSFKPGLLKGLLDRQAKMFDRLAQLFERGDLDLALKHSIPIDNDLVDAMKRSGGLALGWQLPENLVDYAYPKAAGAGHAAAPVSAQRIAQLTRLYAQAAERLSAEGRHRQAAYVYSHLLKDYARAAEELEKGGFPLEAAALLKEKLGKPLLAAQVLERGGHVPEAVEIYLHAQAFEAAVAACERAGLREDAERCLTLWLESLLRRGLRLEAGDLLRDRFRRIDAACEQYRTELRAPHGLRGQAGARLAGVELAGGATGLAVWAECEAFLRGELQAPRAFAGAMKDIVTFHREVRRVAGDLALPDALGRELHRRSRASLMGAVREAQRANQGAARSEAVEALAELLGDGQDPLSVQDLRRAIATGMEGPPRRPRLRRRLGGILPMPGGELFCWVRSTWATMNATGMVRSERQPLGALAASVAIHPVADEDGALLLATVSHDFRVALLKLARGKAQVVASLGVPGATTVVAEPERPSFLVGTSESRLLRATPSGDARMRIGVVLDEADLGPLRWLEWWVPRMILLGGGDRPQLEGILRPDASERVEVQRTEPVASEIGVVEQMALGGAMGLCVGRDGGFGLLRNNGDVVERLEAPELPEGGVTACAWIEPEGASPPLVALGYEDGRLAVASVATQGPPALRLEALLKTSMGPIAALRGLAHDRLMALDLDFAVAVVDLRSFTLGAQGPWS
jgi:hypothetical protein